MKPLLFVTMLLMSSVVIADTFSPTNWCTAPWKPFSFTSQIQLDRYNAEARRFQSCIDDFIEEQEDAIRVHRSALNDAINEWNRFAR